MVLHEQGQRQALKGHPEFKLQEVNAKSPNTWCVSSLLSHAQILCLERTAPLRVVKCVPISDSDLGVGLFQKALSSCLLNLGLQVQKTNGRLKACILFKVQAPPADFRQGQKQ